MTKKNSKSGFSKRLSHLMKEKQLTLAQVASAIGTSAPSVHRWTKGGEIDYTRVAVMLLDEFRSGKLGKISLEWPEHE